MNARPAFIGPSAEKLAEIQARALKRPVNLLDPKQREFNAGEKALIRKVHGYLPALQLLSLLNERLEADTPGAPPFTMEQLHAEVGDRAEAPAAGAQDWSSLRKLLAKARREGLLEKVTRQVIDDFAVVFSLSPGQVLRLQDVLLRGEDE